MSDCPVALPLHDGQWEVYLGAKNHKRVVLVAGRRWGKGEVAAARLTLAALTEPEHFAYIAPSYKMARRIEWQKSLRWAAELTRQTGVKHKVNKTDLIIEFATGGSVGHYGADNPDSLRGVDRGFAGVVLDEFDFFRREPGEALPYLWDAVVRPALADTGGWAQFQGTPDGFSGLYELHKRGIEGVSGYASFHYKSLGNPLLDRAEIEEARATTDPRLFKQEWEASFESPSGTVYDTFTRADNVRQCPFDKGLQSFVGMDFNIADGSPMSAVVGQLHGRELHICHAIEMPNCPTQRFGETLRAWLDKAYGGQGYQEPELWVDPSGNARQHALGQSDVDILRLLKFTVRFRTVARESDKYNSVRAFILSADGVRRLFVDPACRRLVDRLEQLVPDDTDDHLTDALGYLIYGKWPLKRDDVWS